MDFTFIEYEEALINAQKLKFKIFNTKEFIKIYKENKLPRKYIILRHDCERDLEKASTLAEIENSLGIKSTFFIRVHSEWYNINQIKEINNIKKILSLGHEIGLHYEPKFYSELNIDLIEGIQKDLVLLNQYCSVSSISAHQPLLYPPKKDIFESLDLIDMYTHPLIKKIPYFSDSGMIYREYSLKGAIEKLEKFQFLIHPDFWNNTNINWFKNYDLLVEKYERNIREFEEEEKSIYKKYIMNRKSKDKKFFSK